MGHLLAEVPQRTDVCATHTIPIYDATVSENQNARFTATA